MLAYPREVHEQAIDPDPDAARGRHAVLHGAQVILVHLTRLVIARRPEPRLRLEPLTLIDRVVQLAEGVRQLLATRKQFEPLRERVRISALRLGQRATAPSG
jgi:hypothetical protein